MRRLTQWTHGVRRLEIVREEQRVAADVVDIVGIAVVSICVVEWVVQEVCYSRGLS